MTFKRFHKQSPALSKHFRNVKYAEVIAQIPNKSYSEIKQKIVDMIDSGYEDLDILVAIGEYPREQAESVLADCRNKGLL
jgi:hypothetical protein